MLIAKILFNNVISTPDTCFMTMDISNFYLMTPLNCPEYICINSLTSQMKSSRNSTYMPKSVATV
ncbi:hypothetical protein ACHAW6_011487 [Cyclotella cf. meneghiniana]